MIETFGIFIALALSFFPGQVSVDSKPPPEVKPPAPHIAIDQSYTAKSIVLFDFNSNDRVVDFESNKILAIASITKIMTGYLALKNIPPTSEIRMSKEAVETGGAIRHFTGGEIFSLNDVIEVMMTASSNDAAMSLAERVGNEKGGNNFNESIEIFVRLMNETAKNLSMNNTLFINPTGLDASDHTASNYSTANDLEKLIKITRKETPMLWELSRNSEKSIFSDRGLKHNFMNINILAPRIIHFIGGKTGSTDAARDSVIELFEAPFGLERGLIVLSADPDGKRFEEALRIINQLAPVLP